VAVAYHYETWQRNNPIPEEPREVPEETREEGDALVCENFVLSSRTVIAKREEESGPFWELSQISTPKGVDWYQDQRIRHPATITYSYYHHESSGAGQYVYVVEDGIWDTHPVRIYARFELSRLTRTL
jgi:hypothetical protein